MNTDKLLEWLEQRRVAAQTTKRVISRGRFFPWRFGKRGDGLTEQLVAAGGQVTAINQVIDWVKKHRNENPAT